MDKQLLKAIGLTEGETKVYETLLLIGQTTTGQIIKKAKISGGKVYQILDKLIDKGLVGSIQKDRARYFTAADPKTLLDYVAKKQAQLTEQKHQLEKDIKSWRALPQPSKYEAQVFVGYKGITNCIHEVLDNLTSKDEVWSMGIQTTRAEMYNVMWVHWHNKRIKKKIKARLLFSDLKNDYANVLRRLTFTQTRVLKGITPSAIGVMGDYTLLFTFGKDPICIRIKNKDIAQTQKSFFNSLWQQARKI